MFQGLRVVSSTRSTPYVCRTCRSKANRARAPREQRRWITRTYLEKMKVAEEEWTQRAKAIKSGQKMSMLDFLEQRGYVNQIVGTRDQLDTLMTQRRVGVYCGVDPTAPSLHVGHMVPFMVLGWLYIHGYSTTFLLGGATARIGDPTDRLKERAQVNRVTRKVNMASMHAQLKRLGELIERHAERRGYMKEWAWHRDLLNNNSWYNKLPVTEFLRTVGAAARIGPMLGRDTVKNRMEKGSGMSFAEFTYPLVQAYDWWELFQRGVQIQVGGADQFGNILAGAEVVKQLSKMTHEESPETPTSKGPEVRHLAPMATQMTGVSEDPMGFTVPLLTSASGEKFGKSAGNAIWLDMDMTSSYDLYQFFLRSADADVGKYLKLLTFMPLADIEKIMEEHHKDESKRIAQHRLAREFVELVHGLEAAEKAEGEHRNMFGKNLSISEVQKRAAKPPSASRNYGQPADLNPALNKHAQPARLEENMSNRLELPVSLVVGQPLSKVLWSAGLVASRSEGQRLINNRGVHFGGRSDGNAGMDDALTYTAAQNGSVEEIEKYLIDDQLLILRIGKWKMKIITIVTDKEFGDAGLDCPGWKVEEEKLEDVQYDAKQARIEDGHKRRKEAWETERGHRGKGTRFGVVGGASWGKN